MQQPLILLLAILTFYTVFIHNYIWNYIYLYLLYTLDFREHLLYVILVVFKLVLSDF